MGIFSSKDELTALREKFLFEDEYEVLITQVVHNLSHLISPRNKDPQKTKRIQNAAPIMHNTIEDILDYIQLDPTDLDDVMLMSDQHDARVRLIHPNLNTGEWLDMWDDTQDSLSKIHNILSRKCVMPYHFQYYKTMMNIRKAVRFMYKKRDSYS